MGSHNGFQGVRLGDQQVTEMRAGGDAVMNEPKKGLQELEEALEAGRKELEKALETSRQQLDQALEKGRQDLDEVIREGQYQVTAVVKAGGYSWQGLRFALNHERAFRLEAFLALFFLPLAVWLGEGFVERALLVTVTLLVPIVELVNSAIEANVDLVVGNKRHKLAGRAKDLGSAAVFVSLLLSGLVWGDKLLGEILSRL